MHKITHEHDQCLVFALPGPVRSLPKVMKKTASGDEYEDYEWPTDWELVGRAPGIETYDKRMWIFANQSCSRCKQLGSLISLELPKSPAGTWPLFGELCPLCDGPIVCVLDVTIN